MVQVLEQPIAPETVTKPPLENRLHRPEIYQGNINKMDVLNLGENGQDRAVLFQLKQGTQKDTFVLGMDAQNPGRVINLDTSDKVLQMTPEDFTRTAILQRQDNELVIYTPNDQEIRLTQEQLRQNPHLIQLTGTTGVEILDFDPEQNSIIIHKTKPAAAPILLAPEPLPPAPIPLPLPGWRQKILDLIDPVIVATTLVTGSPGSTPIETVPPPAVVEPAPAEIPQQIPETLQCPATKEMTVAPGDSLTKLLVDVNGLPRYLADDGKSLDVQKLYKDLACMLVIPENRPIIAQSDSDVASLLDTMFQNRTLIGPLTPKMIYDMIDFLNAKRSKDLPPGASPQLVIIQPGQHFLTPDFSQPPKNPDHNPPVIPPTKPEPQAPLPQIIPNPPNIPHPSPPQPQGQQA